MYPHAPPNRYGFGVVPVALICLPNVSSVYESVSPPHTPLSRDDRRTVGARQPVARRLNRYSARAEVLRPLHRVPRVVPQRPVLIAVPRIIAGAALALSPC